MAGNTARTRRQAGQASTLEGVLRARGLTGRVVFFTKSMECLYKNGMLAVRKLGNNAILLQ